MIPPAPHNDASPTSTAHPAVCVHIIILRIPTQCHHPRTLLHPRHHLKRLHRSPHLPSLHPRHLARSSRQHPVPHPRRTAPVSQIHLKNQGVPSWVIDWSDPRQRQALVVTKTEIFQKEKRYISLMHSRPPKAAKRATSHMSSS